MVIRSLTSSTKPRRGTIARPRPLTRENTSHISSPSLPVIEHGSIEPPTPMDPPCHRPNSITHLIHSLDSTTDAEMTRLIQGLPTGWEALNPAGLRITKKDLLEACWGSYKNEDSTTSFTSAILAQYPCPPHSPSLYSSQHTEILCNARNASFHDCSHHLTSHYTRNLEPCGSNITVFQVFHLSHFTALVATPQEFHHYDSLPNRPPIHNIRSKLHRRLRDLV